MSEDVHGLCATLVALGRYSADVVDLLDYTNDVYAGVPDGTGVLSTFECLDTAKTELLVKALGLRDVYDIQQHCFISPENFNYTLFKKLGPRIDHPGLDEVVRALVEHQFRFFLIIR